MSRSRIFLGSLAAILAASACDGDPNDPGPDWPPQGTLVSGNLQQATVGAELPQPIVVRVTDQEGDPVPGQVVTFTVTAGGGTLFAATAETSAAGEASNRWTLGTVADTQRVEARLVDPESGQPVVLATFLAIGRAGAPATITARPPAARTGSAGQPLADSLEALVQDQHGNPVPNATVAWLATSGGGAIAPATTTTGATGIAWARWTLGAQIGTLQVAEASLSPAVRAQFTATASVPVGAVLAKVSGDGQSGTVGTSLAQPVVVEARTSVGLPLQGVSVTWTPATGSGTATPPVSVTGPDGRASTTWSAGTTPGAKTLMASADGVSPVTFEATANPGAAAGHLAIVDGDGQTAPPTALLPQPLAVRAADAFGNPLAGVTVTWAVTGGGGSVAPPSSQTDASGVAQAAWTLGATQGEQTARASAPGTAPGTFSATAEVGPVDSIVVTPATVNFVSIGAAAQLTARAIDAYGNTVSGTLITWTSVPGAVASVDAVGRVTSTANGTAQIRASGGGKIGTAAVTVAQVPRSIAVAGTVRVNETDTVHFTATVRDAAGALIPGPEVTWSTGNPAVATVSPTGVVTGTGGGTAVISATAGTASRTRSITVRGAYYADSIAVGAYHTCGVEADGTTSCWGFNRTRQLTSTEALVKWPKEIDGQSFVAITTGSGTSGQPVSYTCGLQSDGDALCWGSHESGQLGYDDGPRTWDPNSGNCNGSPVEAAYPVICAATPTQTAGGGWRQVDAGANHTCAVTTGGVAFCWGRSTVGQLGSAAATESCYDLKDSSIGSFACILTPVPVSGALTWRQVSAGDDFTCALTDAGAAYCWGLNNVGQLGNGTTANATAPTAVSGGPYRWVSAGRTHACAVTTGGTLRCWGSNNRGRLGDGSTANSMVPVTVAAPGDGSTWASVEAGDPHTCAVTTTGRAFCWGGNANGALGDGTTTDRVVPTAVATTRTFTAVGTGLDFTCGRSSNGIVFCWGNGNGGKVGNGSVQNTKYLTPVAAALP